MKTPVQVKQTNLAEQAATVAAQESAAKVVQGKELDILVMPVRHRAVALQLLVLLGDFLPDY